MKRELEALHAKTVKMQEEMSIYQDVDKLKADTAENNARLQKECRELEDKTRQLTDLLKTVQHEHSVLKVEGLI